MSDNYEIPAQTDIRTSDLPDFIGIIPKSVLSNRYFGCEEEDTVIVHCNLVCQAEGPDENKVVAYDKYLTMSSEQFDQFEIAMFESKNTCVLFKSTGGFNPSYTFSAGKDFYNRKDRYVVIEHKRQQPTGVIAKLLNFPSELRQLLGLVHNILETHKTVRNVVEVKYDRSNISRLKEDLRENKDQLEKTKNSLESMTYQKSRDRVSYHKTYDSMKEVNDQLLNRVMELENQLGRQEEDVLREAERIKSRIAAEQKKEVGGKS